MKKRLLAILLTISMIVPNVSGIVQAEEDTGTDTEAIISTASEEVTSTEASYMSDSDYTAFGFSNLPDADSYVDDDYDPLEGYQPMILNELYIGHLNHPDDYQGYFATAESVETISAENLNLNTMQNNNVGGKKEYYDYSKMQTQCINAIALTPGKMSEDGAELCEQILIETRLYQDTDGRHSSDFRVQAYSLVNGSWTGGEAIHKRMDKKDDWVGSITIREQGGYNSMAVGDFDGDDYNEVAVFCPYSASSTGVIYIYEPELQSNGTYKLNADGEFWIKNLGFNWADGATRPFVTLTTTNMAGRDDLVVSVTLPYNTTDETCYAGLVAVLKCEVKDGKNTFTKIWENKLTNANDTARFKLQNVTNADLNADGQDEIVIAGHKNTGYKNGDDCGDLSGDDMFINVLLYNGSSYYLAWENCSVTVPRHPDLDVDGSENGPISLTAGRYLASEFNDIIFCEGVFLHFTADETQTDLNKQIENVTTFTYNSEENLKFSNTDNCFIGPVATGCFVEDQRTLEQTVVMQGHEANIVNNCDVNITWFYGGTNETIEQIESNNDYINNAAKDNNGTCVVLAPVNVDGDSYYIKYKERYYGYSNPSVIGVLLSQPYWEELDYDSGNGSTSFTVEYTESSSATHEGTVGFDLTVAFGGRGEFLGNSAQVGFDGNFAAKYAGSRSNNNSKTQSKTWTASGEDMVVVTVVPIVSYYYEIINPVTEEVEPLVVNTSYTPAFANISVEKYNRIAEQFNTTLGANDVKLTLIDLDEMYYEGYEAGDPSSYPSVVSEILGIEDDEYRISDNVSVDANGSGSTTLSLSENSGTTKSDGFNVSLALGGSFQTELGLKIFGIGGGSYLNITGHINGSYGYSYAVTNSNGHGYSGNVANLPDSAQTGTDAYGNATSDYAFTTQLVQWKHTQNNLAESESGEVVEEKIPYIGYITVTSVTPPRRVQDLEVVTTTKTSALLKWSKPKDRTNGDEVISVDSYKLYMSTSADGEYQVIDAEISGDTTSYLVSGLESGVTYYFKIASNSKENDTSVLSPVAVGKTKASGAPIITLQPQDVEAERLDYPEFTIAARAFETDGVLSYQWEKQVGDSWVEIEGATGTTFNPAYQEDLNPTGMLGGYNGGYINDPNNYLSLDGTVYRCVVTETQANGTKESAISVEATLYVMDNYAARSVVTPTLDGRPKESDGEVYQAEGAAVTLQYGFEESFMSNTVLTLYIINAETDAIASGFPMEVTTDTLGRGTIEIDTLETGLYYAAVKYAGSENYMPATSEAIILHITGGIDINYELNGGTNSSMNPSRISKEAEDCWLYTPTKENNQFLGWYMDEDFTTPLSGTQKNVFYPAEVTGDSITVYAKWQEDTYHITYELNGGTNGDNPSEITAGDTVTLKDAVKEGYEFEGWYLDAEFTTPCESVSGADKKDVTVYAKWSEPVEYRIQYMVGVGVNAESNPSTYTIESDEIVFADATSEDYTFTGWYSDTNLTTKITSIPKGSTGDVIVYAGWTLIDKLEPNAEGIYEIDSYEDLIAMAKMVKADPDTYASATYVQTTNINCKMGTWPLAIGTQEAPFNGTYEGNGYYILGLRPTSSVIGLFGVIGTEGIVRDLSVVDFDYEEEARYASGFAGINFGLIDGCGSGVNLTSTAMIFRDGETEAVPITTLDSEIKATKAAGGLVVFNEGTIKNSRNNAEVTIISTEDSSEDDEIFAGGIAAENTGIIMNVYQNGVITGGAYAGGIAGINSGTIQYGYNSSDVTGTSAGAIVGMSENTEIQDMFYESVMDKASGNQEDADLGVTKMAAADMKTETFKNTLNTLIEGQGLSKWSYSATKNAGYPKFGDDTSEDNVMVSVSRGELGKVEEDAKNPGNNGNNTSGNTTNNSSNVGTGDQNNILLLGILLLASASCIVIVYKKKRGIGNE